jgi:hypothetical protein
MAKKPTFGPKQKVTGKVKKRAVRRAKRFDRPGLLKGGITGAEARTLAGLAGRDGQGDLTGWQQRAKERAPTVGLKGLLKGGITRPEAKQIRGAWLKKRPERLPFDPLATSFKTMADFNKAVNRRALGLYDPLLDEVTRGETSAGRIHGGRQAEIGGWQGGYQGAIDQAYRDTESALNNLVAMNVGGNTAMQDSMRAALNRLGSEANAQAMTVGGAGTQTPEEAAAMAAAQNIPALQARQQGFTGDMAARIAQAGTNRALPGLMGFHALNRERARYGGVLQGLAKERADITSRIPAYREQARAAILEEERAKAGQSFQQELAGKQFSEEKRQARESEKIARGQLGVQRGQLKLQRWLARTGFKLDKEKLRTANELSWAELALNEKIADREFALAQQEASGPDAQLIGKRWDNGVSMMAEYLQPANKKERRSTKLYNGRINSSDLFRMLTVQANLPKKAAARLMSSSSNSEIRKFGEDMVKVYKKPKSKQVGTAITLGGKGYPKG